MDSEADLESKVPQEPGVEGETSTPENTTPTAKVDPDAEYAKAGVVGKPTGRYEAKKIGSAYVVVDPDGRVFRSYTKDIHKDPEEAATGFAEKMNNKR